MSVTSQSGWSEERRAHADGGQLRVEEKPEDPAMEMYVYDNAQYINTHILTDPPLSVRAGERSHQRQSLTEGPGEVWNNEISTVINTLTVTFSLAASLQC